MAGIPLEFQGIISLAGTVIYIIIGAAMLIGTIYFIGFRKKFPVKVIIFEERSGIAVPFFDKMRRFTDKATGEEWYEFQKRKKKIKTQEFRNLYNAGRTPILFLFAKSPDEYHAMTVQNGNFKAQIDIAQTTLAPLLKEKAMIKYQTNNFWAKYGHVVAMIIMFIVLAVSVMLILKSVGEINSGLSAVAASLQEIANNMGTVVTANTGANMPKVY